MFPKKTVAVVVVALLAVFAAGTGNFVRADEEAGICERALRFCFTDPYILAGGWQLFFYCVEGYAFCKKYVEPLLRDGGDFGA